MINCENCKNREEDIIIYEIVKFPYNIPKFHDILLAERVCSNITTFITIFINKDKIFIKASDFKKNAKYLLHFSCQKCKRTKLIIPSEMICNHFIPSNKDK